MRQKLIKAIRESKTGLEAAKKLGLSKTTFYLKLREERLKIVRSPAYLDVEEVNAHPQI